MTKSRNPQHKVCAYCNSDFVASNSRQLYCKKSCKTRAYELRKSKDSPEFLTNEGYEIVQKEVTIKLENKEYALAVSKKKTLTENRLKTLTIISNLEQELKNLGSDTNAGLVGLGVGTGTGLLTGWLTRDETKGAIVGIASGLIAGIIKMATFEEKPEVVRKAKELQQRIKRATHELKKIEHQLVRQNNIVKQTPEFIEEKQIKEIKLPKRKGLVKNKGSKASFTSAADLLDTSFDLYELKPPFGDFLGSIARNSFITTFGKPGGGKSTFFLQLADFFTQYGLVLYVTPEEGVSPTFQAKLLNNNINNDDIHITDFTKLSTIRSTLKKFNYSFCFIDSINMIVDSDPEKLEDLRKEFPDICFAVILQSTKDGKFKGSNEYAHNSDIHIEVVEGVANARKNRFRELSEYQIFSRKRKEEKDK